MSYLKIRLIFKNDKTPYLLDISSLLYDFELLHDFVLMIYVNDYKYYKFSNLFWYRQGRPIKNKHKIKAIRIKKESPLIVELIIHSVMEVSGALWVLVQVMEKITNWNLNREKLKLEIEKLKKEIKYYEEQSVSIEKKLEEKKLENEALNILTSLLRRLEENPLKLEDFELLDYNENNEDKNDQNNA